MQEYECGRPAVCDAQAFARQVGMTGRVMTEPTATGYMQLTMRPVWEAWAECLRANWSNRRAARPLTDSQHQELRTAIVALASARARATHERAYELLRSMGESHELASRVPAVEAHWATLQERVAIYRANQTPLVMTGHQPNIFHPGIEWKYRATAALAEAEQGLAIAIWMDADPGDAGAFLIPQVVRAADAESDEAMPSLMRAARSVSQPREMMTQAIVDSRPQIQALAQEVTSNLCDCDQEVAAHVAQQALDLYARLAGTSTVDAHQIIQCSVGRESIPLQVPFSQLMALPLAQRVIWSFVLDAPRLVEAYNGGLDAWRKERGIRSAANPFPNLAQVGVWQELPFWILRAGDDRRRALMWRAVDADRWELRAEDGWSVELERREWMTDDFARGNDSVVLLPRGAMISLFFRIYLSDLFVHGTGGGTYDQFTDRFIQDYLGQLPPAFVVASGTRRLFPEYLRRLKEWDELAEKARDILHHPENYLGREWFDLATEAMLQERLEKKKQWIDTLRTARRDGRSGAEAGQQLELLTAEIKQLVQGALEPKMALWADVKEATRATLQERTWPWFYFEA